MKPGLPPSLRIAVLYNRDEHARIDVRDVENAARDVQVALGLAGHDARLVAIDARDALSAITATVQSAISSR